MFFIYPYRKNVHKNTAAKSCRVLLLFLAERLAVSALIHGGVCFMSANQDSLQGAIVCTFTVMCALGNGTFDALVCIAVHSLFLLFL